MSTSPKGCQRPPPEKSGKLKESELDIDDYDLEEFQQLSDMEELQHLSDTLPIPINPTTICYRAACCPSCVPCGPCGSCGPCESCGSCGLSGSYPRKSICGGRQDVITAFPRIDMKEIDACVRCCVCGRMGSCASGCTRCQASPPHNKPPCDPCVPCLPVAPRRPLPFGVRCPSPPCVPPSCAPVCGAPSCPTKCPPC